MNAIEALEHSRLDLAVDSITFFRDGARVQRVVPAPRSGEVSLHCGAVRPRAQTTQATLSISGFDAHISFNSIQVEPPRNSNIRICKVDRQSRPGDENAVRFQVTRSPTGEPSTKSCTESVAPTEQLRLAYITSSMRWSAFYVLNVHSKNSSATLVTAARLHNYSSETWDACKISLSSQQVAAVSVQLQARARMSFHRSFHQPKGRNAAVRQGGSNEQLSRVSNMQLRYPHARPGCLARKVGLDTTWNVPGRQAFFPGVMMLSQPIDCAEFRGVDHIAGAGYVEVHVRSELPIFTLPGRMQVNLDGANVNEIAVPARSPLDPIRFTCVDQRGLMQHLLPNEQYCVGE